MNDALLFDHLFVVTASATVRSHCDPGAPILRAVKLGDRLPAHPVRGTSYKGRPAWARVKLPNGAIGYIWSGYGTWEEA